MTESSPADPAGDSAAHTADAADAADAAESERHEPVTMDKLLETSARLFRRNGYSATTTRELARSLKIKPPSLYHHIEAKEDLLFEISIRCLDAITAAARQAATDAAPTERLSAIIAAHLETSLRDRDRHATMLIELNHLSPERRQQVVAKRRSYEDLVRAEIASGQERGDIRSDVSARHLTLALLNLLNWTIFWYRDGGAETTEVLAQVMSTVFLDGARMQTGSNGMPTQ